MPVHSDHCDEVDFHIGDRVVVRDWEDMAREFGMDEDGDIPLANGRISFIRRMRPLCGTEHEIVGITPYSGYTVVGLNNVFEWTMCPDMLRKVCGDEDFPEVDTPSFLDILCEM